MHSSRLSVGLFVFGIITAGECLSWGSSNSLPDGSAMTVCVGRNVTLAWFFSKAGAEHVVDIEWYIAANGQPQTILGTYVAGSFLEAPSAGQLLDFLGQDGYERPLESWEEGAGIVLHNVSTTDSGRYTVKVNVNLHGSMSEESQSVTVSVTACNSDNNSNGTVSVNDTGLSIERLEQRLHALEAENSRMKEILANNPQIQDAYMKPSSCQAVKAYNSHSGVHTLLTAQGVTVPVYCDQTTSPGGWTVIQRRVDGSVDFYRDWFEYDNGFGHLEGEFWLGLNNVYLLTSQSLYRLRVELEDFRGNTAYAEYRVFTVGSWDTGYQLNVSGYLGTAGDALGVNSNNAFSTYDRDHDSSNGSCAQTDHAGWWFAKCSWANPNGRYKHGDAIGLDGITWYYWKNDYRSLKKVEMKIRPN